MVPMNRLGNKLFSTVLALVTSASLLAGCGGSHSTALPKAVLPDYNGPLADAVFKISIPGPSKTSSSKRTPQYVSSATKSVKFFINSTTNPNVTNAQLTAYNAKAWHTFDVGTLPNATCPVDGSHPGNFICTVPLKLPPGTDNVTIGAYDNTGGTGNLLSQQIQDLAVVAGVANSFNVTLDANLGTLTINGSQACQGSTVGSVFGSVGTTPVNFSAAYTDPATKTVVAPGLPVLQIQANHAGDTAYHPDTGIIDDGHGNTVTFTINQNTQSFVLTPSSSSVTSASINIKATPKNTNGTSDGLGFSVPKTFAFSTGIAPPTHNFLAAVEQTGAASGQVDFFNATLGGNTPGSDSFATFAAAPQLAVTASNGGTGPNDVDNPVDLRWDTNGDLLVANAGVGAGDNGNVACVPIGAIATGANTSTTVTTNVDDPANPGTLAYDSRDGSLALANTPVAAPVQLATFLLNGNYVAGSHNLTASTFGTFAVTEVPGLSNGTFAVALATGAEEDATHAGTNGSNKIGIFNANTGATSFIGPDDTTYSVDEPNSLAWDAQNSQLVIANFSTFHRLLSFYNVSPVSLAKTINTTHRNTITAASPDGHVAVGWITSFGFPQVQVYDNTASRNPVFGPFPFNGTTTSCGSTYIYGTSVAINAMRWLSNTKLMVAVNINTGASQNANNGLYVLDISNSAVPTGFDDVSCSAFAAAPVNTGFVHLTKKPFGIAFKP
jgi:hypothetical protein